MPTSRFPSRKPAALAALAAALLLLIAGCGGSSNITTTARPHTDARLQILSPTPNEVTGPSIEVRFAVEGAKVSLPSKTKIVPDEGHIHVSIDGKLIVMSYGTSTEVHGLTPGLHTLQAQFVANDHLPFSDPVNAAVIFTVKT
jgi:hypothetical protein